MSHNLNIAENGQASMFYTGQVPWHQLGRKLDKPATAAEAIEAANLDYTVVKNPLKAIIHNKHYRMRCNIYFVMDESGTAFFTVSLPSVPWPNVNIW
jgi:hypothetical protein